MKTMAYAASLLLGMLILPCLQALPTDNSPSEQSNCDLDIQANDKEIRGVYKENAFMINFHASLKDDKIQATSITTNSAEVDAITSVSLTLPNVKDRMIPGIERMVVESAEDLAETTDCEIPSNLNRLHEQLADKLFQCTGGFSQLEYSIVYLGTVVSSANRLCSGAESICSASPEYTFGNGAIICQEDFEELFPEETLYAKELSNQVIIANDVKGRGCPLGKGSDHGCCGNYSGCCYFKHFVCYVHDIACSNCDHWYCGPWCKPDSPSAP